MSSLLSLLGSEEAIICGEDVGGDDVCVCGEDGMRLALFLSAEKWCVLISEDAGVTTNSCCPLVDPRVDDEPLLHVEAPGLPGVTSVAVAEI